MSKLKRYVVKPLILIGALNWGLIGIFNYDLVAMLFGAGSGVSRIIYSIIGIAAIFCIITMFMPDGEK